MTVRIEGIQEAIDFVEEVSETAIVRATIELEGLVRDRTPVDTGFARNSWYVTQDRNDEGEPGANPEGAALQAQLEAGYRLGGQLYINNGAVYIGKLEEGRSNQAPNGMVDVSLPEMPDILADKVRQVRRERGG